MPPKPGEIIGISFGAFLVVLIITIVVVRCKRCTTKTSPVSVVCSAGTAGPSCAYSDDITCNARGIAQGDGTCVCAQGQCGTNCASACSDAVPGTWEAALNTDGMETVAEQLDMFTFGEPEVRSGYVDAKGERVDNIARTWYTYTAPNTSNVELGFRTLPDGRKEVVFLGARWEVDSMEMPAMSAVFTLYPDVGDFHMNSVEFYALDTGGITRTVVLRQINK
jgi:hypothetical protein